MKYGGNDLQFILFIQPFGHNSDHQKNQLNPFIRASLIYTLYTDESFVIIIANDINLE